MADETKTRLVSLDQFRGYTVAGMLLVNFLGSYQVTPRVLKHTNDYCSYADTIMPQFFFAVGFALQIVFNRARARSGSVGAKFYLRLLKRCGYLAILAVLLYFPYTKPGLLAQFSSGAFWLSVFKRDVFQTLLHIAVTSIWIAPVLQASVRTKIAWGVGSGVLHLLLSKLFYFDWVHASPSGIDGGPLGFLTWSIPTLAGLVACDVMDSKSPRAIPRLLYGALVLMGIGYAFSCGTRLYDRDGDGPDSNIKLAIQPVFPDLGGQTLISKVGFSEPPFIPPPAAKDRAWNYWMMSQRAGTLSYQTFAAGFALLVFLAFRYCCDVLGWQNSVFQAFGTNALAVYVVHGFIDSWVGMLLTKNSSPGLVLSGLLAYFVILFGIARWMQWRQIHWRL